MEKLTSSELQSYLQNFANSLGCKVEIYDYSDKRKNDKFQLMYGKLSISPALTYMELNMFMLGMLNCANHEIKIVK